MCMCGCVGLFSTYALGFSSVGSGEDDAPPSPPPCKIADFSGESSELEREGRWKASGSSKRWVVAGQGEWGLAVYNIDERKASQAIPIKMANEAYNQLPDRATCRELFNLVLADWSNCLASISGVNARCLGESTRIQMAYIRDSRRYASICHLCAPFDLSDIWANFVGNLAVFSRFVLCGHFEIAFMMRKERKLSLCNRRGRNTERRNDVLYYHLPIHIWM